MPNLSEFSKRIKLRGRKIITGSDKMTRKVALAADQAVVSATPVDTGRARSNWIVQLDAPANEVIEAYAPGKGADTGSKNTQAAIDQGEAVIAGYKGGGVIHITNNLAYIGALNDGHSRQAPSNFVDEAILEAGRVVQSSKIVDGGRGR